MACLSLQNGVAPPILAAPHLSRRRRPRSTRSRENQETNRRGRGPGCVRTCVALCVRVVRMPVSRAASGLRRRRQISPYEGTPVPPVTVTPQPFTARSDGWEGLSAVCSWRGEAVTVQRCRSGTGHGGCGVVPPTPRCSRSHSPRRTYGSAPRPISGRVQVGIRITKKEVSSTKVSGCRVCPCTFFLTLSYLPLYP